ncbi:MAG TPA: secretin N-terminal domain-containing protein, partial [Rhodoferax sp.]|nr:secretin N-terminal domain-containing protein [Rhodoferax sp.]
MKHRQRPPSVATLVVAACALLTGATAIFPVNSLAQTAPAAAPKRGQPITLNFTNADIEAVARTMATLTGRNVVVDPRVKGTITLNTESPVSPAMAYYQFRTLLRLQGYTVVQGDDLDRVLPEADAKLQSSVVGVSESGEKTASGNQLMTQIIRLQHENANNLVTILRPLISPNNTINVNPGTNSLVITDYADNLRRLARIVAALDVANATGVEVVQLKHANASDLAPLLLRLLESGGTAAGGQADASFKTTVLAEPRSNALILRAANQARLALAMSLIDKLDQPGGNTANGDAGNIYVVYLKNANAVQLAPMLRAAMGSAVGAAATTTSSAT